MTPTTPKPMTYGQWYDLIGDDAGYQLEDAYNAGQSSAKAHYEPRIAELERKLNEIESFYATCGIIEIMVRNPNIDSFVKEKEKIIADQSKRLEFLNRLITLDMRMRCGDETDTAFYKDVMSKAFDEGMMKLVSDGRENYEIGM